MRFKHLIRLLVAVALIGLNGFGLWYLLRSKGNTEALGDGSGKAAKTSDDAKVPLPEPSDGSGKFVLLPDPGAGNGSGKVFSTSEDVKALLPSANWLETTQGEASFMFCAYALPSFGESYEEVQGWVFRRLLNQWDCVLKVQLYGVGSVSLSVDPKTGLFTAKGRANNKFKDVSVLTFDLGTVSSKARPVQHRFGPR